MVRGRHGAWVLDVKTWRVGEEGHLCEEDVSEVQSGV